MTISLDSLEGRLMAQRKLLARIVAVLDDSTVNDFLSSRDHFEGNEEDPGDYSEGWAIEGALADELRLIREAAEAVKKG